MNVVKNLKVKVASLLLLGFLSSTSAYSKDAFGLDDYKHSIDSITKPDQKYLTKYGNQLNVYSVMNKKKAIENKNSNAKFLVQGGLHGNELLGSEFVGWLAQRFASGKSPLNKLNQGDIEIDFLPYANPDGTIQFTRYNGNKINLNRNFSVLWGETKENPGPKPFSESETRAIRDLFKKRNYTGSIDVHGYINWIVVPTSPEDDIAGLPTASSDQIKQYNKWINAIKKETSNKLPGYEIKTAGGLGDGGAFEDYAWWEAAVPSACLEIFSKDRFVPVTIASKLLDLITPKAFASSKSLGDKSDTFLVYESYVTSLFQEALKVKSLDSTKEEISASVVSKKKKLSTIN